MCVAYHDIRNVPIEIEKYRCISAGDDASLYFILIRHGPLTIYIHLRGAHAPGTPGTFSPPPTSKETASL